MRLQILIAAAAVALAAGCDRSEPTRAPSPSGSAPTTAPSSPSSSSPSSTSASGGATAPTTPSQAERKDGANPVQGQVDPKQREQHKDFQQKGDGAGPTSPDTKPKN